MEFVPAFERRNAPVSVVSGPFMIPAMIRPSVALVLFLTRIHIVIAFVPFVTANESERMYCVVPSNDISHPAGFESVFVRFGPTATDKLFALPLLSFHVVIVEPDNTSDVVSAPSYHMNRFDNAIGLNGVVVEEGNL
jgi:hypothetical protein